MRDSKKGLVAHCWRTHWIQLNTVGIYLVLEELVRIHVCWCRSCQTVKWTKHSAALILLSLVWGCWAVSSRFLHFISSLWVICTCVCKIVKSEYWLHRICSSVDMGQLCSHWTDLYEIWYSSFFKQSVKKIQVSLKLDKNNVYFTCRPIYIFLYCALFLEWEIFQIEIVGKIKTHILCSVTFFWHSYHFLDNVE